jgi:hypothetical protein
MPKTFDAIASLIHYVIYQLGGCHGDTTRCRMRDNDGDEPIAASQWKGTT